MVNQAPKKFTSPSERADYLSDRTNRQLTAFLKILLLFGAGLEFLQGNWLAGLATLGVLVVCVLPVLISQEFDMKIPPEFELCAVLFVMASLFLGEVQGYYQKFWWWDLLLHGASGLLLGIFGFLLLRCYSFGSDPIAGLLQLFSLSRRLGIGRGRRWQFGSSSLAAPDYFHPGPLFLFFLARGFDQPVAVSLF